MDQLFQVMHSFLESETNSTVKLDSKNITVPHANRDYYVLYYHI